MNIIYLRTSTEEQNPQNQIEDCKSINQYGEYIILEEKQSAWKDDIKEREVFRNVRKQIKAGKLKHLIVWNLDRIYRNRRKLIEFFQFCNLYKCKIHSYRQAWLEDLHKMPEPFNEAMYDFMLQILGWIAEEESKQKGDRVRAAIVRGEGKMTMSKLGSEWGRKPANIDIKKVLELSEQGLSYREIANKIEYKNSNGKLVHPSHVTIVNLLNKHSPKQPYTT
jgi:DNA invertase Pin-like site-specific DNA recombinase